MNVFDRKFPSSINLSIANASPKTLCHFKQRVNICIFLPSPLEFCQSFGNLVANVCKCNESPNIQQHYKPYSPQKFFRKIILASIVQCFSAMIKSSSTMSKSEVQYRKSFIQLFITSREIFKTYLLVIYLIYSEPEIYFVLMFFLKFTHFII